MNDAVDVEHEQYATWDAAYALGALAASERVEFEAHLARCARCRRAVAGLASTTALLSRLSLEDVERIGEPDPADGEDAPVRLLEAARARRRLRRRALWWAAGVAAALLIAVPVAVATLSPRPAPAVALEPAPRVAATASVALTPVAWGTRLDMTCTYPAAESASGSPEGSWTSHTYVLAVIDKSGATTSLSTWNVEPGVTAKLSAGTAVRLTDIRTVEVRDTAGDVLLRRDFP
ncbi:zf-HC2 domain-containing protein [Microbacterium sp. 22242]|uniref:zf-HC2 domain-containing protein n=1 Tax=Microbacterium sp. 22242 TaxID=3453896 RepID=UPI003F8495AD